MFGSDLTERSQAIDIFGIYVFSLSSPEEAALPANGAVAKTLELIAYESKSFLSGRSLYLWSCHLRLHILYDKDSILIRIYSRLPYPVSGQLPSFGAATSDRSTSEASRRGERDFWTVFDMGPLSTGTSEQSPRDERPADRSKNGNVPMLLPVFGTATLPTGISEPSLRGHCDLVFRIAALLGFVKFTWHEPLLIIK